MEQLTKKRTKWNRTANKRMWPNSKKVARRIASEEPDQIWSSTRGPLAPGRPVKRMFGSVIPAGLSVPAIYGTFIIAACDIRDGEGHVYVDRHKEGLIDP